MAYDLSCVRWHEKGDLHIKPVSAELASIQHHVYHSISPLIRSSLPLSTARALLSCQKGKSFWEKKTGFDKSVKMSQSGESVSQSPNQ